MLICHEDIKTHLAVAKKAVLISWRDVFEGKSYKVLNSNERDLKIDIDVAMEEKIISVLKDNYEYPIVSEELNNDVLTEENKPYWIVDPLDGTFNFSRNFPISCISVALYQNWEPMIGVVYDIYMNKLYYSLPHIAKCDQEIVSVSTTPDIDQSVLATGFPINRSYSESSLNLFIRHVQSFKKIRMIGSAAMALTYVAKGTFDAYFEEDIMLWDVAAGLALVKAAGGEIFLHQNYRTNCVTAIATNGKIPVSELQ